MKEGYKIINRYIFQLGKSTMSWSSKWQNLVSLSVYKAEIQVLVHTTQEAIWLKHFIEEVLQTNSMPIMIHCDNQATVQQVKIEEMTYSARTRHLDLRKDFVLDYIS